MYINLRGLENNLACNTCPFMYLQYNKKVIQDCAIAYVNGGTLYPEIHGIVKFNDVLGGVYVCVKICGLPQYKPASGNIQPIGPFGFHIHQGSSCSMDAIDNHFPNTGGHFNPGNQPHGNHAGDFPVLFSNTGYCEMMFFTDKFNTYDIIGKTIVIHENPDDYRTEPSGNSGRKIACGEIISCSKQP